MIPRTCSPRCMYSSPFSSEYRLNENQTRNRCLHPPLRLRIYKCQQTLCPYLRLPHRHQQTRIPILCLPLFNIIYPPPRLPLASSYPLWPPQPHHPSYLGRRPNSLHQTFLSGPFHLCPHLPATPPFSPNNLSATAFSGDTVRHSHRRHHAQPPPSTKCTALYRDTTPSPPSPLVPVHDTHTIPLPLAPALADPTFAAPVFDYLCRLDKT